jgi:hypothetical protein
MRVLAIIVIILGLGSLVLGILFFPQASSGEKQIKDSLAPDLVISQVNAMYDKMDQAVKNTAKTDPAYSTYFANRTSLGLAKANIGTVKAIRMIGIAEIAIGLGLVLGGFVLLRKNAA